VSRSAYNESYPEPDGRSGTHVPIKIELGDAMDHIGMFHEQPISPVVPAEPAEEEEDPEEIEGVSEIDFEHAPAEPNPQPDDSSSGSASSVGNLDDF